MSLPDHPPHISKWFFLLSDALLVAVAAFIASRSATPLSTTVILAIVGCVATGALITAAAFVADYTRKQDEALDDRQRALESLARTVATSAEQISIAASGLHEIGDLVQRNLRHAEKLPHQLHEKIAEFQAQLTIVNDAEKEELEKELVALRTSESERLDSVSDKIAKTAAEWTKLEAATQKHLAAATESLGKAQLQTAATLDAKLAAALAALEAKLAALEAAVKNMPVVVTPLPATSETSSVPVPTDTPTEETVAHPPKRPRKPRREDVAVEEKPVSEELPATAETPQVEAASPTPVEEPPPIPAETIPEVMPAAPDSAEPFPNAIASAPAEPAPVVTAEATESAPAEPKPARKRAPKKPVVEPDPSALSLNITETPHAPSAEVAERGRSSDGATRLIVTAYIGIGNRLFIRGEGPGLTREKGVPLQFVSIGKWRWETNDATGPVRFKLFKNDETECAALGEQTLAPGDQQEVTASF